MKKYAFLKGVDKVFVTSPNHYDNWNNLAIEKTTPKFTPNFKEILKELVSNMLNKLLYKKIKPIN